MRFIYVLLLLISFKAYSDTEANCRITRWRHNSRIELYDLKFETVADIFTIKNAYTLSFVLDDQPVKAIRSSLETGKRETHLIYLEKKKNKVVRAINIILDGSTREIQRDGEFRGSMLISQELQHGQDWRNINPAELLQYNFSCEF